MGANHPEPGGTMPDDESAFPQVDRLSGTIPAELFLLLWHGTLYLIDHGATLTFHHRWSSAGPAAAGPYDIAEHALLGCAALVDDADAELAPRLTAAVLQDAARQVPDEWLAGEPGFGSVDQVRDAYVAQLTARLAARPSWLPPLAAAARAGLANVTAADRAGRRSGRPAWLTGQPEDGGKL